MVLKQLKLNKSQSNKNNDRKTNEFSITQNKTKQKNNTSLFIYLQNGKKERKNGNK